MKRSVYILLAFTLFSCKPKNSEPVRKKSQAELHAEYLQKALKSDTYKDAYMNVQRVNNDLDSVKKGTLKPEVVLFIYNNSIATATAQAKTIPEVEKEMKKDTAYLKAVQLRVAAEMATADSTNMNSKR